MNYLAITLSLSLGAATGGCACLSSIGKAPTVERPLIVVPPAIPANPPPVIVQKPVQPTPAQVVKKRWYNHFPKHPKLFHDK